MSDGATQNGETQAASTGAAAAVAGAAVPAAAAPAAPVAAQVAQPAAAPAVTAAAAATAPAAAVVVPAAVAVAPAAAAQVDCKPVKKKAHLHDKKDGEEDHARAPGNDEDQNLSQPADGCVLPQTGQAAAPVQEGGAAPAVVVDEVGGGGLGSNALLIGAGVLAAIGVGVLAASSGGDDDDTPPNANPVATADTGAVNEGASLTGSVATNDTDADGDALTFALSGAAPAGLTFNPNGSYTFDANNAAYNALAAGATQVVAIPYTVSDGKGGTASSTLTITVTGTNDSPVVANDTAAVNEDASITGNLRTNDSDPDTGDTLTYSAVGALPAGLTLNADGTYSFNAANAAYQGLGAGQTRVVTATVAATDGKSAAVNQTLTITVTGTNDVTVAGNDAAAATEGSDPVTGDLRANDTDADTNATLTYSVVGTAPAGLTVNPNGTFTFDPTVAAYNSLAAGQTQVLPVTIAVSDGTNPAVNSTLTITVTGTNDAPVAVADTAAGNEDTSITGSVATNDTDVDTPAASLTYSVVGTAPAGFTLNANGTYTLDTRNAAYQNLTQGQVQNVVVNYRVADGQGGTADSTLTIAVTGVAETVNLDTNTINPFDAGVTDFRFTDTDDVANSVVINNFSADDVITFDAPFSGAGQVTFANVNSDGGTIANDLRISTTLNGQVSEIILTNVLSAADAAAGISTEAAAEAAIGANFDNFRTTAVDTPVATTTASLDVDNDSNSLTARPFDASTDAFRFTDSATVESNAVITGLGANDRIVFTGTTAAGVSYTAGALDADGLGNDLSISINNNGVVSLIVLKDAIVNTNVIVFNEATAEQALGGIDYFQFA